MNALRLAALAAVFAAPAVAADPPRKPNVLFIVADDLRADLGCYGSVALTPHIDALAKRGVLFRNAYCQQAVCNPSRSSFLTGKRPDTLKLWVNGTHFREKNPDVMTLPLWFKQHGYTTRDVGKIFHNWHTKEKGDRRSWSADEFLHYATHGDDTPHTDGEPPPNLATKFGRDYGNVGLCERRDVPDAAYFDGRVAAEAVKVLGEVKGGPFFLAVGFWKPHAPMNAPKRYWDRYDPAKLPPVDLSRPTGAPAVAFHESTEVKGPVAKQIEFTPEQVRELRHGYFAGISFMDEQVGKVLSALEKHGLADNTVVVFLSDHGYHLGEHSLWGKTSCFELDARVPLIVCPPKAANAGKSTTALAELVDLFPTLTDLCGLPAPPKPDGVSLAPVVADPAKVVKPAAFSQHPRPAYFDRTPKGVPDAMGYSIRTDAVRYTEWRDWATGKPVGVELYDHRRDPGETRNVIDAPPDPAAQARAKELLHAAVPPIPPSRR